jgi:hypothetical protein
MRSTGNITKASAFSACRVAAWHADSHELQHTQDSGRVYLHYRLPSVWVQPLSLRLCQCRACRMSSTKCPGSCGSSFLFPPLVWRVHFGSDRASRPFLTSTTLPNRGQALDMDCEAQYKVSNWQNSWMSLHALVRVVLELESVWNCDGGGVSFAVTTDMSSPSFLPPFSPPLTWNNIPVIYSKGESPFINPSPWHRIDNILLHIMQEPADRCRHVTCARHERDIWPPPQSPRSLLRQSFGLLKHSTSLVISAHP